MLGWGREQRKRTGRLGEEEAPPGKGPGATPSGGRHGAEGGREKGAEEGRTAPHTRRPGREPRRWRLFLRLGQPAGPASRTAPAAPRRPSPGSPSPRRLPIPSSDLCHAKHPPPHCACARNSPNARAPRPSAQRATAQLEPRPELSACLLECGGQRAAAGERCHFQAPVRAKTQL